MSYYGVCKENIILADCEVEELIELVEGLQYAFGEEFVIKSKVPKSDRSMVGKLKRYVTYILYPLTYIMNHKKYKYIIGWQQFYALLYAFYCRIFHIKKGSIIVALNFTYKEKKGVIGKIYKKFMEYCVKSDYLDYIHVLSNNYAKICAKTFEISEKKFIVTPFGLPDTFDQWKDSKVEYNNYSFSIGRSNRDFDFLVNVWKKMPKNEILLIASDVYKPAISLPANVIHRTNISGDLQFAYIANCKSMIISIDDGKICSGDTVLLKAMSYEKPVIVTIPSTLAEMYIVNEENGLLVKKSQDEFIKKVEYLLENNEFRNFLSKNARKSFEDYYSRKSMGINVAYKLLNK